MTDDIIYSQLFLTYGICCEWWTGGGTLVWSKDTITTSNAYSISSRIDVTTVSTSLSINFAGKYHIRSIEFRIAYCLPKDHLLYCIIMYMFIVYPNR